jgi:hypothetical protein
MQDRRPGQCRLRDVAGDPRSRGVDWILFLVSVSAGPIGSVRTGREGVEVLTPLVAAVFADPRDQCVPARIVIQQVQQLPALREAVLVRDGEVLIESVPDGPCEKAACSRVTAGAASPCTANGDWGIAGFPLSTANVKALAAGAPSG